jgi:hypothetical protein
MGVKMVALKLSKHYKNNFAGEVAGFPEAEAEHIMKNGGGEKYDPAKHDPKPATPPIADLGELENAASKDSGKPPKK